MPALFLFALTVQAQDTHSLKSPDGRLEFHLYIHQDTAAGYLPRIAYDLSYRGKPLLVLSYLGLDIVDQEPFLGENDGLVGFSAHGGSMTAGYMQNGSLGRKINVEARIANDGAAFRYIIPRTTALFDMPINTEMTEFALPVKAEATPAIPYAAEIPGAAWIAIGEINPGPYPAMRLVSSEGNILTTRFAQPWDTATPFTTPWRVVAIGDTRESAIAHLKAFRPFANE
ncbi:MAG: glycoside hydrolase family 97 N-terminal domain-containing protein [Acidobacteriota bacterium]|nr:glycoside hydrolase family 97 N-terminal domain-containing protein [Acidobacteriota bacterium]